MYCKMLLSVLIIALITGTAKSTQHCSHLVTFHNLTPDIRNAQLICRTADGRTCTETVEWRKDGFPVDADVLGIRYSDGGASVIIDMALPVHEGNWTCHSNGQSSNVLIFQVPPFLPESEALYYELHNFGDTFTLSCNIEIGTVTENIAGFEVTWISSRPEQQLLQLLVEYDSQEGISIADNVAYHPSNFSITIHNFTAKYPSDGYIVYSCRIVNKQMPTWAVTAITRVSISQAFGYFMTLITEPEIVLVNTTILCEMSINDFYHDPLQLVIDWFHNGVLIHSSLQTKQQNGRYLAIYNFGNNTSLSSTLEVINLASGDNGNISCKTSYPVDASGLDPVIANANLVVLGNDFELEVVFRSSGEVTFVINLPALIPIPVGLYFIYHDVLNTSALPEERNSSTNFNSQSFTYDETDSPEFDIFQVQLALVVGDVRGPLTSARSFDRTLIPRSDPDYIIPAVIVPILLFICILALSLLYVCRRYRKITRQPRGRNPNFELLHLPSSNSNTSFEDPYLIPAVQGFLINQVSDIINVIDDPFDDFENKSIPEHFVPGHTHKTTPSHDGHNHDPDHFLGPELLPSSQPLVKSTLQEDRSHEHIEGNNATSVVDCPKLQCSDVQIFIPLQSHNPAEPYNPLLQTVILRSHSMEAIRNTMEKINALKKAGVPYIFIDRYLEQMDACYEQMAHCRWLYENLRPFHQYEKVRKSSRHHNLMCEQIQRLHYQYKPYEQIQPYIELDLFTGEYEHITNPYQPYDPIGMYERINNPYNPGVDPVQYRGRRHSI